MLCSPSFWRTSEWPSAVVASLPAARITTLSSGSLVALVDIVCLPYECWLSLYGLCVFCSGCGLTDRDKARKNQRGNGRNEYPEKEVAITDAGLDPATG